MTAAGTSAMGRASGGGSHEWEGDMLSKAQIRKAREMSDEYHRLMATGPPTTQEDWVHVAEVTGFLACAVKYLLDEIERLQAREQTGMQAVHIVKADIRGGSA